MLGKVPRNVRYIYSGRVPGTGLGILPLLAQGRAMGLERLGAQSPVQILVVSRVDGGFANKWHIAMYENAKVVCSVLSWVLGTASATCALGPRYRDGSRDVVRIAP